MSSKSRNNHRNSTRVSKSLYNIHFFRSLALQKADVILLLGARTNWILHFGRPPRFAPDVKIIQIDIQAEELHNSIKSEVAIQSDMQPAVAQITAGLKKLGYSFSSQNEWWKDLAKKCEDNQKVNQVLFQPNSISQI